MSTETLLKEIGAIIDPSVIEVGDQLDRKIETKYLTDREKKLVDIANAVKSGFPIINLRKAIFETQWAKVGKHDVPSMAVANAQWNIVYLARHATWDHRVARMMSFQGTKRGEYHGYMYRLDSAFSRNQFKAVVPMIPVELRPRESIGDLSILWEAQWTDRGRAPLVKGDPFLLKLIEGDLYSVLATWDISDREIEAIRFARR